MGSMQCRETGPQPPGGHGWGYNFVSWHGMTTRACLPSCSTWEASLIFLHHQTPGWVGSLNVLIL